MHSLRIVFMGTPEFAVASLEALLHSKHQVVGVVTAPDAPAGRGLQMRKSAVKECAEKHNLPVLQPAKLKAEDFLASLKSLNADLFVVVAFRMLPEIVWTMPPMGTINLHGSLLPRYRGAAPIHRAVMNGDTETGVSTFFLQHEIDTGNILRQASMPIGENDTTGNVHDRMMVMGAEVLVQTVHDIADGKAHGIPQEDLIAQGKALLHAPKIFKEDCRIDFQRSAQEVHNFVRGLNPFPVAFTHINGKMLKLYMGQPEPLSASTDQQMQGEWSTDGRSYLRFRCVDGWYNALDVQLEGKKRMGVKEFLMGRPFEA